MKIVVLGGSGFLGSHVADELSKRGHKVTIFDLKKSKWIKKNQNYIKGNILNFSCLEKSIKKAEIVYHFAALSDLDEALHKPIQTVTNNILGTVNVLELSKKYDIKRIIYASSIYSMSVQGGFYRCSKKASEDYIEEYYKRYGLNFTILRYGSLYGERSNRSNGVFRAAEDALRNKKIQYTGNKNSIRKYINVIDAAKATTDIISTKYKNKYINIVGAKSYKVNQLFKIIFKSLDISGKVKYLNEDNLSSGHYVKSPKLFKLRTGLYFKLKKNIPLEHGIRSVINNIKTINKNYIKI